MRVLVFVVVAAGCTRAPVVAPAVPENQAPAIMTEYVLVSLGAWLRTAPRDDASGARTTALTGAFTDEPNLERVAVMRLVARHGHWLEVENLTWAEADAHCYGATDGLAGLRLRLFVRTADIVPATRRAVDEVFEDGTGVQLAAGVAIGTAGDRRVIGVDGIHPALRLTEAEIAMSYPSPSGHFDDGLDDDGADELPPGDLTVDGEVLDVAQTPEHVHLYERDGDPAHHGVELTFHCSQYRAKVPIGVNTLTGYEGPMGGFGYGNMYDLPKLAADTPLTWRDGSPAGVTLEQLDVRYGAEDAGDRPCFYQPVRDRMDEEADADPAKADYFLELCADPGGYQPGYGG